MNWWGKLIGGLLGFVIGGPIGAIIGVILGHGFDVQRAPTGGGAGNSRVQAVFFRTTFSVLGHLAKADGRVSESEIQMARNVMRHMNLSDERVREAIRLFNDGKRADFPLRETLAEFRQVCGRRMGLLQTFLEIQVQAAMADGQITDAERRVLNDICAALGLPPGVINQLEALIRMQQGRGPGYRRQTGDAHSQAAARPDAVADAYGVLGVESSASDGEVKKAYRRLMSRHHPDKLAAKGLPEEMMRVAQEKAQEITRAYDIVKEARGMS